MAVVYPRNEEDIRELVRFADAEDISKTIHAHPTLAEIMLEAGLKATGKALHG